MRITGGQLKGRVIKCPDGAIRPAMDRMRESVFAILGDLSGKSWLDLFSGSGTIAIEAVSRGAARVELCEKDRLKIKTVLDNVSVTEKEMGVKIKCRFMAVELFVKRCKEQYDYIFFDPPFPYKFHEQLIAEAAKKNLLLPAGVIMVHRPEEHFMPDTIENLVRFDQRVYGRSIVDFYKRAQDAGIF
ncbi:MAG: 16S rRNA (guanine(966)-N(2))-methyltransferase RsmD [Treponema sp.]|nr:16S rRNA (guanine(966)-N(2))-methyltransferase RsmD [Treponema sp.]